MYYSTRVLLLLVLQVVLVHCFPPWDIVVGTENRLEFYYNGTLTHTEDIPSADYIDSVTYDPVHYRVLFTEKVNPKISISSFDLLTRKIQPLVTIKSRGYIVRVTYDPVTQLLFWNQNPSINSFSLNPAACNNTLDGNILVTISDDDSYRDIAVDSCEGHIYWATDHKIERIRFDGSEREVIIESTAYYRSSLAIDQQTQRMYWIDRIYKNYEYHGYIESADFSGKNRKTLHEIIFDKTFTIVSSLAISKDFIYWRGFGKNAIWQLPKNSGQHEEPKSFPISDNSYWAYQHVAAYNTIMEQTEGNPNCKILRSLMPNAHDSDSSEESFVCFHGTKVSGESRCVCKLGYTGEKCDVSSCHNYCFQGNCSVSAEGQPICRCNAGYSGERCEVNACHKYCLNNGDCSLNEEDEPVCECLADYEGERCEVAATHTGESCCCQNSKRDLRKEVRQAVKEELQHTSLRFVSNKMDEYEVKV